uniref:SOWAHA-C winged helix-turn-helix domain-containing protein n=1 Tax=Cyprinus carpio TaxID=7962 RepID=A0A8C2D9W1_CYPCA
MATDFTQDSVLRFIINNGGTVRNADLLTHYRRFLREDGEREQNRELFKRYVNSVATVRQEEGVSHVVLRKKYRVHLGDVAKNREPERDSKQAASGKPQAVLTIPTRAEILPVAGILTNNDSTPSFEKAVRTSPPHGREQPSVSTSCEKQLEHNGVYVAKQRQLREADGCEQSFVNPAHCAYYEVRVSPTIERQSTSDVHIKEWPLHSALGQPHIYKSSPCLLDRPVSPHIQSQTYNQAGLSRSNDISQSSSRGQSSRELSSPAGSTRSLSTSVHDGSFSSKHSSIPLDPREHDWFVKAALGTWTDIYALFRDDPNLLTKRDFISGFTVVHWIAKHGDHRVLNTLWYGVNKVGMTLDVNAKTLGGYTPLHLAAIHGHKKLIRLLVQKFKADVRIRDSSGKRPWQYLSKDEQRDILELLGAPQKRISGSPDNLNTCSAHNKFFISSTGTALVQCPVIVFTLELCRCRKLFVPPLYLI